MVVEVLFGVAEDIALLAGEDLLGLVAPWPRMVVHLRKRKKLSKTYLGGLKTSKTSLFNLIGTYLGTGTVPYRILVP